MSNTQSSFVLNSELKDYLEKKLAMSVGNESIDRE